MILEIPNDEDFKNSGLGFINLALDQIFELYSDLSSSEIEDWGEHDDIETYWIAAKIKLNNSLALIQQGIEFILKGRIVSISPYLLIASEPKEWSNKWEKNDVSFSEFRTLDAQDLIKVNNIIHPQKLSEGFITKFNDLRQRRNAIMHTISKSIKIDAKEIIIVSLEVINELIEPFGWINLRRKYLEESPVSAAFSCDHVELTLLTETHILLDLLSPSETKKYFNFNKKQRRYICPTCSRVDECDSLNTDTALLEPNKPDSTSVYCFICEDEYEVIRLNCPYCKGNVIESNKKMCLTCGETVEVDNGA